MSNNKNYYLYLFLGIGLLVIAIAIIYSFSIDFMYGNKTDGASVGDSFGALNAIFSGLAFSGVILTVVMQKDELKLQREELKDTRKEFQMGRATNVIYKQLERFDFEMSNFEYVNSNGNVIHKGTKGILALNSLVKTKPITNGNIVKGMDEGRRVWLINQIKPMIYNSDSLLVLTTGLILSVRIVNEICSDESFTEIEKIKLKSLFYKNIGTLYTFAFEGMLVQIEEFKAKIYNDNDTQIWGFSQGEFEYLRKSTVFFKLLVDNLKKPDTEGTD